MYASPHRPRPSFLSLPTDVHLRIFTQFQRLTPPWIPVLYPAQIHPSLRPLAPTLFFRHPRLTSLARFDAFRALIDADACGGLAESVEKLEIAFRDRHAWEKGRRKPDKVVQLIGRLGGLRELRIVNVKTLGEDLLGREEVLPWMTEVVG